MSRRTLGRRINCGFQNYCTSVKQELQQVRFFCTTADIWSGKKRSFLGVTVHFINENCERKSTALACRRFRNIHSYDRIAELLCQIYTDFEKEENQIVATITDNGSNVKKAFKMYGVEHEHLHRAAVDSESGSNSDSSSNGEEEEEERYASELETLLPAYLSCCAHTLNLCATTDVNKILETSKDLIATHRQV